MTSTLAFFRAIPVLTLIFCSFFLMPLLLHVDVPGLVTVVGALAMIGGAYLSHSVYAGIRSISEGQRQAEYPAQSTGKVVRATPATDRTIDLFPSQISILRKITCATMAGG
jgi:ABC-type amino acid transport system permease subunit